MKQIYIVIEGGCLRYVSTDSEDIIKNVGVTLIDLDDQGDSETDQDDINRAAKLTKIW